MHRPLPVCLLCITLSLAGNAAAFAGTDAAAFLQNGLGARAMGMGGAYVSVADDPSAVYWNPAGLGQLNTYGLLATGQSVSDGAWSGRAAQVPSQTFFAAVIPIPAAVPWIEQKGVTVGLGYLNSRIADVSYTRVDAQGTILRDTFDDTENAWFISCGLPLREASDRLYAGATVKYLTQQFSKISGASASGYDADVGLLYAFSTVSVGVVVQRGVSLRWDNGHTDTSPLTTKFGISNQFALRKSITLLGSFDIVQRQTQPITANAGAELMVRDILTAGNLLVSGMYLRTGIDGYTLENRYAYRDVMNRNVTLTAGAGIAVDVMGYGLKLDYVCGTYRLGDTSKFSVGIVF